MILQEFNCYVCLIALTISFVGKLFLNFSQCAALEVDLMTTDHITTDFNWQVFTTDTTHERVIEWEEVTYNIGNQTKRGFQICPADSQDSAVTYKSQSWLIVPEINVLNIARIFIEMEFTLRDCSDIEKAACRETFSVYYYYSNSSKFVFNQSNYMKIDTVAAEVQFNPYIPENWQRNKETVYVSNPKNQKIMHLAIVDEGACMAIISLRAYHKMCPKIISNLAIFNTSLTGDQDTSLIAVKGICVENSNIKPVVPTIRSSKVYNDISPIFYCTSEGLWQVQTGECLCKPGYTSNSAKTLCYSCPMGTFKTETGNEDCKTCPPNSHTKRKGATLCHCNSGFYQNNKVNNISHVMENTAQFTDCGVCATLASRPLNVEVNSISMPVLLNITWDQPLINGNCENVYYTLLCFSNHAENNDEKTCDGVEFYPNLYRFQSTYITASNLRGHTHYNFTIIAINSITFKSFSELFNLHKAKKLSTISFNQTQELSSLLNIASSSVSYFTNETLPTTIQDLRVMYATLTTITITWKPPKYSNGNILHYEIYWQWILKYNHLSFKQALLSNHPSFSLWENIISTNTSFSITNLDPGNKYHIFVRAVNNAGPGNISDLLEANTSPIEPPSNSPEPTQGIFSGKNRYYLIAVLSFVLLSIFIAITICIYFLCNKKLRKNKHKSSNTRSNSTEESHQLFSIVEEPIDQRTYVDPFSLNTIPLHDFKCEISPSEIELDAVIGYGQFGDVYNGRLRTINGMEEVAIKQLRDQCEPQEQVNFLREAWFLAQFQHPNIVTLKAVVTLSRPFIIITELMANGSLLAFLLSKKEELNLQLDILPAFPITSLLRMLRGVARGMAYITRCGYVHRDIAARNVLVDEYLTCKVADFGLMREMDETRVNSNKCVGKPNGKIAIRWASPEALSNRDFSQSSDVWSFGVLCWEALTYGEKPYWDLSNQDVIQALNEGFRLPASENCPHLLYQLMVDCWLENPKQRPTFMDIIHKIDYMLSHIDEMKILASPASTGMEGSNENIFLYSNETPMASKNENRLSIPSSQLDMVHPEDLASCSSTICASDITVCPPPINSIQHLSSTYNNLPI